MSETETLPLLLLAEPSLPEPAVSERPSPRENVRRRGDAYLTIAAGHAPRREPVPPPAGYRIFIRRLQFDACIGVYEWEKLSQQPVVLDLEFGLLSDAACHSDRLADTVDYARVVERLRTLATSSHYELVESLAETMALALQEEFGVPWLTLSLSKLAPFPGAEVGIVIERGHRP
jgi:7,8-dihydroneopterin aldolase/epimerase/oxygenase